MHGFTEFSDISVINETEINQLSASNTVTDVSSQIQANSSESNNCEDNVQGKASNQKNKRKLKTYANSSQDVNDPNVIELKKKQRHMYTVRKLQDLERGKIYLRQGVERYIIKLQY